MRERMKVSIDLSEFTGPWNAIKARMGRLPDEVNKELAGLAFRIMPQHTPVESGYLTNTVWMKRVSPGVFHIGPTAWYSYYPRFYGKRKKKYTNTYPERTLDAMGPLMQDVANARAYEFLVQGVE